MIGNGLEVEKAKLKELLSFCGKLVLDNNGILTLIFKLGIQRAKEHEQDNLTKLFVSSVSLSAGVVRQFTNSGPKELPYRMKRHQEIFGEGS